MGRGGAERQVSAPRIPVAPTAPDAGCQGLAGGARCGRAAARRPHALGIDEFTLDAITTHVMIKAALAGRFAEAETYAQAMGR